MFEIMTILNFALLIFAVYTLYDYWTTPFEINYTGAVFVYNDSGNESYMSGFYSNRGYYCVATQGRTIEEIATTDEHEKCHALIHSDYKHFCEDWV